MILPPPPPPRDTVPCAPPSSEAPVISRARSAALLASWTEESTALDLETESPAPRLWGLW